MPDHTTVDPTTTTDGLRALASFFWHLSRQGTPGPETMPLPTGSETPGPAEVPESESPTAEVAWLRQLAGAVTPQLEQVELQRLTEELLDQGSSGRVPNSPESVRVLEPSA